MHLRFLPPRWRPSLRGFITSVIAAGLVAAIGLFLFAWSGIYNLAASRGHFAITRALLAFGLYSSVRTHSIGIEAPPLDDVDMIRLGAGHYAGGCAPCHGAPGTPINRITAEMLPPPPDIDTVIDDWSTEQLFWIVQHGIKYTGMPAWPAQSRSDEVWSVVAFLERMPGLSEAAYRDLANFPAAAGTRAEPPGRSNFSEMLTLCARCHGDEDSPPTSRLVPRLSGQSARYMADALRDYAKGARYSGVMAPVASELEAGEIDALAGYYARLAQGGATTPQAEPDAEQIERGRAIATGGVEGDDIPACLSCHGANASGVFPRLQGQHAAYIAAQLKVFRSKGRGLTTAGTIMQTIAERLSDAQIADAAAYFASIETDTLGVASAPSAGRQAAQ